MTQGSSAWRTGALLAFLAGAGWIGAHLFSRTKAGTPRPLDFAPTSTAAFDSATVSVRGEVSTLGRARLAQAAAGNRAILVLLDSADIRVCEDLGRQLRALRQRAGPALPFVVLGDSAALPSIRAFARREHLRPDAFVSLGPAQLVAGRVTPTPAVVVMGGGDRATVVGVAHPRRFRNVRIRSFADELSADLPGERGDLSSP